MAVVGRPLSYYKLDGNIFMERVSKYKCIQTCTAHTNFSDEAMINTEIKSGNWQKLFNNNELTTYNMILLVVETYDLDDTIVNRLGFSR